MAMLAIWVERWFAVCALLCGTAYLISSAKSDIRYPLMSFCNLVFTGVLLRIWFPRQELEKLKARRQEIRQRARRMFLDVRTRARSGDEETGD